MSNGVLFCVRVRESGVTVRVCKSESSCSCGMGSRGGRCGERTGLEGDERALGCFREWRRNTRCHFGRKSEAFLACWRWSWYGCDLRLSSSSSSREWQSANHVEHAINVSIKKKKRLNPVYCGWHRMQVTMLVKGSTGVCLSDQYNTAQNVLLPIPPSLPLKTSDISPVIPCPPLLIQPPCLPTSRRFSMLPWPSTSSKLGKISATTHSPTGLIAAMAPILSSKYFKNNPRHLMKSGTAIPNCSSGSDQS
ncbi:hypothetical protein DFH94DRAFT_277679 [Russula ochroleuca]|jgi:hypothetical protein|uniref:Uncharacterized protein n=1 Tax=Russula ochroleuca TaxID=152965 RepID=A0A9P5JY79_9AGAM|nr:hypothetical protein DFH94DRAFT_277679 [Russula ochroleuca]